MGFKAKLKSKKLKFSILLIFKSPNSAILLPYKFILHSFKSCKLCIYSKYDYGIFRILLFCKSKSKFSTFFKESNNLLSNS